ncbi:formate dehydrogenase accessory sulfurtransferase FdhD [Microbulbifer mangrovi]|uniref:formate dehydrogenase accessory sulfurtransferase FdhD n=1 Tax=Microbulbifer mangrovi TaxID=927787 RepID=UPI00099067AD|nr:formate dehydrogenase accessory sulfurtransferase FdhD [Microbulbifer mangrovi]
MIDSSKHNDEHYLLLKTAGVPLEGQQPLAQEVAVAFCYNGISHAVMMASPGALEDFALGFSLTSGVISHPDQLLDLDVSLQEDSVVLDMTLNQRTLNQLKVSRRTMAGTSSCGLCGVDALAQALKPITHSPGINFNQLPPAEQISGLRARFQNAQQHLHSSGAMHAAIYVDERGETRFCREDIGRHNALDKLIGACVCEGIDMRQGFVAITSRCSLELVQKSVCSGVSTLVSLASPSDMAVRWARKYYLNLLHQPVQGPARLYSGRGIDPGSEPNSPAEVSQ